MANKIAIIGAGLTGLMCAVQLAKRGFIVDVFERRFHEEIISSQYKTLKKTGRAMSMDISARGAYALKSVDAFLKIEKASVPMKFKITHAESGGIRSLPYGQNDNEYILTVSRAHLYRTLFDLCCTYSSITVYFGHCFDGFDSNNKTVKIFDPSRSSINLEYDLVIGADGVHSAVRNAIEIACGKPFITSYFPMSYKELSIPAHLVEDFEINAMHIWPRAGLMLVAQPNLDGSFTCALLMPKDGPRVSFSRINSSELIRKLFDDIFPDVSHKMPHLENEYLENPIGDLKVIAGSSWTFDHYALVLGDAAHGMVPFFGQGVNCCFEDCTFLAQCLDESNNNWKTTLRRIDEERVFEAQAINTMSYENYPELFLNSDLKHIQLVKEIEAILSTNFKNQYRSYHNLVCFDRIPYTVAQRIRSIQLSFLNRLSENIESIQELNPDAMKVEFSRYQKELERIKKC